MIMKSKPLLAAATALTLLFSVAMSGAAYAQVVDPAGLPQPGTTPDVPFFYDLKRGFENLDLMMTPDYTPAKAEKYLHYAELRLAEMVAMANKGKVNQVIKLASDYNNAMGQAGQHSHVHTVAKFANTHMPVTAKLEIADTLMDIGNKSAKHEAILNSILAKAPEAAKPGLMIAIDRADSAFAVAEDDWQILAKP